MKRNPTRLAAAVTSVDRLRPKVLGPLELRRLPDSGLLGNVSVLHERLPPRARLPSVHHRRTAELVYCVSGSMTAILDGRRRRVRAGGVILIPAGVRHTFISGASGCDCLSVFSPALDAVPGADIHVEP
jgi:quercetin dioxygenase-like cupin family protein